VIPTWPKSLRAEGPAILQWTIDGAAQDSLAKFGLGDRQFIRRLQVEPAFASSLPPMPVRRNRDGGRGDLTGGRLLRSDACDGI
jgi:hypothetical protein